MLRATPLRLCVDADTNSFFYRHGTPTGFCEKSASDSILVVYLRGGGIESATQYLLALRTILLRIFTFSGYQ